MTRLRLRPFPSSFRCSKPAAPPPLHERSWGAAGAHRARGAGLARRSRCGAEPAFSRSRGAGAAERRRRRNPLARARPRPSGGRGAASLGRAARGRGGREARVTPRGDAARPRQWEGAAVAFERRRPRCCRRGRGRARGRAAVAAVVGPSRGSAADARGAPAAASAAAAAVGGRTDGRTDDRPTDRPARGRPGPCRLRPGQRWPRVGGARPCARLPEEVQRGGA